MRDPTTARGVLPITALVLFAATLFGACNGTSWTEDEEAERQVQRIVFPLTGDVEVGVMESSEGARRVELTVMGGLADSLDLDELRRSPAVDDRAQAVVQALRDEYGAFSSIERMELHFTKRAQLGAASASMGRVFRFDAAELDAM
jgi:hypothetical protein